jgi:hypothetical protein
MGNYTQGNHKNNLIIYTPYGDVKNRTRRDTSKQIAIFNNKLKILKIAEQQPDEFFIMRDNDIIYNWGIEEMEQFLINFPDHAAVGLWPHKGQLQHTGHVSTAFMMIRTSAIIKIEMAYNGHCFCNNLIKVFSHRGYKVRYIEGSIMHKN